MHAIRSGGAVAARALATVQVDEAPGPGRGAEEFGYIEELRMEYELSDAQTTVLSLRYRHAVISGMTRGIMEYVERFGDTILGEEGDPQL